ncbi:MAG: glycerophosphodiester phosphodiesterase [Gemmatimonadaceae bacterium]
MPPDTTFPRSGRPRIIAHRGVPPLLPENTLAGFARALDDGADGVELDVHLTADGQMVVHHDPAVAPAGADGACLKIADEPLAALRAASGSELPTLAEVLRLVGRRATAYVELKGRAVEEVAVEVIRASGARCAVHSFDHPAVRRCASLAPELPRGVLLVARVVEPLAVLGAASAATLWQDWTMLDVDLVHEVHAGGGEVVAWTVNDIPVARELGAMGVDAICTDWPGLLRAALAPGD